ncbi:MAG TPA: hypothetical protein VG146_18595 [Verrucomicrobiae bacterium]|nr:hypothetical protein [Verrucomicrobiae bacterium]
MSEFKFACPVCGQHITADSRSSGRRLECPTCFQKIIVPQAPAGGDSKLILSAVQADKPRPSGFDSASDLRPGVRKPLSSSILPMALVALVLGAGVSGWLLLGAKLPLTSARGSREIPEALRPTVYPVPANIHWTMTPSLGLIPDGPAAGRIHGSGFFCERATLQGGVLSLRQGRIWPPDLGLTIRTFAHQPEDLSGKTIEVMPERGPPLPTVILRWKDARLQARTEEFQTGYALKLVFGQPANGRMPGKIYLSFPDDAKSFAAGSFDAQIGKPRQKPPKPVKNPANQ